MKARGALVCLGVVCLALTAWGQTATTPPQGRQPSSPAGQTQVSAQSPSAQPQPASNSTPPKQAQVNPAQPKQAQIKQTKTPIGASVAPAAPAAPAARDGAQFLIRLRDLQARVDELKEQIRRSHARLSLLSDTILRGGVNAARAEIKFQNEMSAAFRVTRVLVVLDGAVQYNKADEGESLAAQRQIPVFNGTIAPGDHTLQVSVKLRGHGYGVFSYLRGFTFDLKDELSFSVDEGKTIQITAAAWEKGGATTALEERPALRFTNKPLTGIEQASKEQGAAQETQTSPAKPRTGAGAR